MAQSAASQSARRERAAQATAWLVMADALLALIWPAGAHAIEVWSTTEEFSFGLLVVPISVGLIASRRHLLWVEV